MEVHAIVATYDNDGAINDDSLIDKEVDTCILIELQGLRFSCK